MWAPRRVILLLFLLWQATLAKGQYVPEDTGRRDTTYVPSPKPAREPQTGGFDTDKLVPGGNLSLSFGDPYYVDISPALGYQVTDDLVLGLGGTYIAMGGSTGNGTRYRWNCYGGRFYGRQRVLESVFANAELDFLNVPYFAAANSPDPLRKWLVSPLVGASYVVSIGKRGGIIISLLYNLNYQQRYSPYSGALVYRMGFFL